MTDFKPLIRFPPRIRSNSAYAGKPVAKSYSQLETAVNPAEEIDLLEELLNQPSRAKE